MTNNGLSQERSGSTLVSGHVRTPEEPVISTDNSIRTVTLSPNISGAVVGEEHAASAVPEGKLSVREILLSYQQALVDRLSTLRVPQAERNDENIRSKNAALKSIVQAGVLYLAFAFKKKYKCLVTDKALVEEEIKVYLHSRVG